MSFLSKLNPLSGDKPVEKETELTTTSSNMPGIEGVAQPEEGSVQPEAQKNQFEWNVGRIYSQDPNLSQARVWLVRILSTLLVFPVVLTVLIDLGRRFAFAAGLVNGKSWSLIDEVSEGSKAVADRVSALFQSKVLSLEEENERAGERIRGLARRLVNGYLDLNGGYLHTNSSFSSPLALSAEKEIARAQRDLTHEVNAYVARNATKTEDFVAQLDAVKGIVKDAIDIAARDEFYIENKVERLGPPQFLKDVVNEEFSKILESNQPVFARQFVEAAKQAPDFVKSLKNGIQSNILTEEQLKEALQTQVQVVYDQGLETGLVEASNASRELLQSAEKEKLVTKQEAVAIAESVLPDVEKLAVAAAREIARKLGPSTTEAEVDQMLVKTADSLRAQGKLKAEEVNQFLTEAKVHLTKAKETVEAEAFRAKQEAEGIEAQRVAEVQKAADQQSLLGKFMGMLGLINQKQDEIIAQFLRYNELEQGRQTITNQLEETRNAVVTVQGAQMTVLQAADRYYKEVGVISNKRNLTAVQKQQQIKDLANGDFSQQTIDKINELKALEPQLTGIIDEEAALSQEIDRQQEETVRLIAVYRVFRYNNFGGLETDNRKTVSENEKSLFAVQKTINATYGQLAQKETKFLNRLRPAELTVPVNVDPEGNRREVEAILDAFEKSKKVTQETPAARSLTRKLYDGTKYYGYQMTYPVRAPYNAFASWWNKGQGSKQPLQVVEEVPA